jgi:two-component system OmpR family sensor kinase
MTNESLVSRLIWLLTSTFAGLWLLGSVTTGMLALFEVNERLDNALVEVAQRLLPATYDVVRAPAESGKMAGQLVSELNPKALAYQIINPAGMVTLRSVNAPATSFVPPAQIGFHNSLHDRVYTQNAAEHGYVIEVAEPNMHRHEALRRSIELSAAPLLFFLPVSWLLIRWAVRRGTRSLLRLQHEIGQRDSSNLTKIPDLAMPKELVPIQVAVNRLLDRLQRALATERQFAANSAHELRTPIAAVLAQLQVLSAQLACTSQAARANQIVQQVKALASLTEKLLQFSRVDSGVMMKRERIDGMAVLQVLADDFSREERVGSRLRLFRKNTSDFIVYADIDVLGIALRNLIENAVRYGAADQPIDITVEYGRHVRMVNGGSVVPEDVLATLKEPFQRGTSIGPGGGLGLAIVESIMVQLGGSLHLSSPASRRDDGFEAILIFPEMNKPPAWVPSAERESVSVSP